MANMMKLTVKTLDSANHSFEVDSECTVEQFKHQIREKLGLEIERQRLIFCGRVLQDDQKLTDCGVNNGKCLHLVQRPPPSPPSRRRDREWEREREREREREGIRRDAGVRHSGGSPLQHHIRHLLANPPDLVFEQQQNMSMTPTNGRMEFIRRMITEIRESMETLRGRQNLGGSGETGEPPFEPMDIDFGQNEVPPDLEGFDNDDEEDNDEPPGPGARSRRSRTITLSRSRYSRPRDLGQLLEELDLLHDDFAPYRAQYVVALRDLEVTYAEPERAQRQHTVTLICDVMHSFAHAYHAISDITFHVGQRYPRLTSEPPSATRYPMPMQAHINVVTTTGRRSMSGDGRGTARAPEVNTTTPAPEPAPTPAPAAAPAAAAAATAASATASATTAAANATSTPGSGAPPRSASSGANERDTFNVRRAGLADVGIPAGTPIHTTTSTFTHAADGASPRRFQVEIETTGHLAFPIDNSLLNGLAAVASNLHQAEQSQEARQGEASVSAPSSFSPELVTRSEPVSRAERAPRPARTSRVHQMRRPVPERTSPFAFNEPGATRSGTRFPPTVYCQSVERIPSDSSASSTPPPQEEQRSASMPSIVQPSAAESGDVPRRSVPRGRPAHAREGARPEANRTEQERPRALSDLENLLRSLSQGGGVEVVMSMEDMPGFMHSNAFESDNDHGVYVTPLVPNHGGGINHSTEFLHNVIANVVRQNIGGAILLQGQNLTGLTGQNQGRPQNLGQAQNQRQPSNPTQRQAQNQRQSNQGQPPNQGQNQRQGMDQGPNQNRNADQRQQWQVPRDGPSRRNNDRVHSLMMACMVYDRYMQCDSQYARHHLQERREHYQQQAEAQERSRAARAAPPVLEVLMSRNRQFSASHMEVMMRLLGGPVCEEAQLNAFMITIARHLFLDPMNEHPNDPTSMPSEFPFIRMQLREYVQGMLETAIETGGRSNTFEAVTERVIAQNLDFLRSIPREHVPLMVDLAMLDDGFTGDNAFDPIADYYVERHSDFLRNMDTITPIDTNMDMIASVRVMTRSRLPAIIACVMSEASSDMFAARFYSVFARFFTDLCTLILCFCNDGFDGLLLVFDAFIARITENYEPVTREWLRTISRENLFAIRDNLEPNIDSMARQYFRRADGSMPSPPASRSGNVAEEQGQVTPPEEEEEDTEDVDTLGSASPYLRAAPLPPVDGESATTSSSMSPELRSPGELNIPRSESESPVPRPFRGWATSTLAESSAQSEMQPGGIITIGLGSSDSSLYDPDETHEDYIDADGPDDYEFTEMQRTLLDRQLHLLEDEERLDVDVVNDDGTPVYLPGRSRPGPDPYVALSEAAMRVTATRLRGQALRRSRLETTSAVRQAELRAMEQSVRDFETDAQLLIALERLQRIADRQTVDLTDIVNRQQPARQPNPPPPEPDSEYSTPPANRQSPSPEEPEFLVPNEPDRAHSPTIHPIYHIDMTEPEFLVPINNLRNRLHYAPSNDVVINELEPSSPDADRLIINEDVDFCSYSGSDTRANDSGENSGYLTPFARNRIDVEISTVQTMQRPDSNASMPEAPQGEVDNYDSMGTSSPLEFAMRPLQRLDKSLESLESLPPSPDAMDALTPPLDASQAEAMTPDLDSEHLRSQGLQGPYEGNEVTQINPPTVPENETEKPEAPQKVVDNNDGTRLSRPILFARRPLEVLTPPLDASQGEAMTPDLYSEHLRPQSLQGPSEGNEVTQINPPTVPDNETEKPEAKRGVVDNNEGTRPSRPILLARRPLQGLEKSLESLESLPPSPDAIDALSPPLDASQAEAMTPDLDSEHLRPQNLQGPYEGNEEPHTDPPAVPENETEKPAASGGLDNNDRTRISKPILYAGHSIQGQEKSLESLESLTPSPDATEALIPSLDASQAEPMSPALESEHLRPQNFQSSYEGNEVTQTNAPTIPEHENEYPEVPRGGVNNNDGTRPYRPIPFARHPLQGFQNPEAPRGRVNYNDSMRPSRPILFARPPLQGFEKPEAPRASVNNNGPMLSKQILFGRPPLAGFQNTEAPRGVNNYDGTRPPRPILFGRHPLQGFQNPEAPRGRVNYNDSMRPSRPILFPRPPVQRFEKPEAPRASVKNNGPMLSKQILFGRPPLAGFQSTEAPRGVNNYDGTRPPRPILFGRHPLQGFQNPEAPRGGVNNYDSTRPSRPILFARHPMQGFQNPEAPRGINCNDSTRPSRPIIFGRPPLPGFQNPEAPRGGVYNNDSMRPSRPILFTRHPLQRFQNPEAPRGVVDNNYGTRPSRPTLFAGRPLQGLDDYLNSLESLTPSPDLMDALTPPLDASQAEVMMPDLVSEYLRPQSLESPYEGNDVSQANPSTVSENDTEKPEAPQRGVDNNDGTRPFGSILFAGRPLQGLDEFLDSLENSTPSLDTMDALTPSIDLSQVETMTPDFESEQSRPQSLQGNEGTMKTKENEGNEETQIILPIVPENETENEGAVSKCSNQDAAVASAQTPMDSVFEHFESNWAPVFREDEAAQARPSRPQEPFSDAYLSGMPSRKRRCVREARPDPSLEGLLTGVRATGVEEVRSAELCEFLRESVRSLVRDRSQREPENFSTSQFQNTAAFIGSDKSKEEEDETEEVAVAEPSQEPAPTPPQEPAE